MALHNGIDTVAFVSGGVFSKTFGLAALKNRCNLFGLFGLLEDAPSIIARISVLFKSAKERLKIGSVEETLKFRSKTSTLKIGSTEETLKFQSGSSTLTFESNREGDQR